MCSWVHATLSMTVNVPVCLLFSQIKRWYRCVRKRMNLPLLGCLSLCVNARVHYGCLAVFGARYLVVSSSTQQSCVPMQFWGENGWESCFPLESKTSLGLNPCGVCVCMCVCVSMYMCIYVFMYLCMYPYTCISVFCVRILLQALLLCISAPIYHSYVFKKRA